MVPAISFYAVTPSDSVDITPSKARALYIGSTGDLVCINASGDPITFVGVVAGTVLPIQTTRVNSTGTSASSIVALF